MGLMGLMGHMGLMGPVRSMGLSLLSGRAATPTANGEQ